MLAHHAIINISSPTDIPPPERPTRHPCRDQCRDGWLRTLTVPSHPPSLLLSHPPTHPHPTSMLSPGPLPLSLAPTHLQRSAVSRADEPHGDGHGRALTLRGRVTWPEEPIVRVGNDECRRAEILLKREGGRKGGIEGGRDG